MLLLLLLLLQQQTCNQLPPLKIWMAEHSCQKRSWDQLEMIWAGTQQHCPFQNSLTMSEAKYITFQFPSNRLVVRTEAALVGWTAVWFRAVVSAETANSWCSEQLPRKAGVIHAAPEYWNFNAHILFNWKERWDTSKRSVKWSVKTMPQKEEKRGDWLYSTTHFPCTIPSPKLWRWTFVFAVAQGSKTTQGQMSEDSFSRKFTARNNRNESLESQFLFQETSIGTKPKREALLQFPFVWRDRSCACDPLPSGAIHLASVLCVLSRQCDLKTEKERQVW